MTPDQILATALALLSAEPAFPLLAAGGARADCPVTLEACPRPLPATEVEGRTVVCGRVSVPENHDKPIGARIDLRCAVLTARPQSPTPDPLPDLHGGPGGGAVRDLASIVVPLWDGHRAGRAAVSFAATLIQDRGLILDRRDGTQAGENPIREMPGLNAFDRTLAVLTGVLLPPFMDYVRGEPGYRTDRNEIALKLEANMQWDRSSATVGPKDLALAMTQNLDLKPLVVHGMHDLSTPCFRSRYSLEQSVVTPGGQERRYFGVYPGGHMFYLQTASRAAFALDVRKFQEGSE